MKAGKVFGLLLVVCLIGSFITATGKEKKVPSGIYITKPVTVDGDDEEWPSPYPYYDSKGKISYAAGNDERFLYLTIKASDEQIRRKLLVGGFKVWLDPTGKKEESISINYPVKQEVQPMAEGEYGKSRESFDGRPVVRDTGVRKRRPLFINKDLVLNGFAKDNGTFTAGKPNPANINVLMNNNSYGELVWEAAIPLDKIYTGLPAVAFAGQPLSICFEVGAMPTPAKEHHPHQDDHNVEDNRGSTNRGNGMNGGMGGGMGNGMPRSGMPGSREGNPDWEDFTKKTRTWFKTGIAKP